MRNSTTALTGGSWSPSWEQRLQTRRPSVNLRINVKFSEKYINSPQARRLLKADFEFDSIVNHLFSVPDYISKFRSKVPPPHWSGGSKQRSFQTISCFFFEWELILSLRNASFVLWIYTLIHTLFYIRRNEHHLGYALLSYLDFTPYKSRCVAPSGKKLHLLLMLFTAISI